MDQGRIILIAAKATHDLTRSPSEIHRVIQAAIEEATTQQAKGIGDVLELFAETIEEPWIKDRVSRIASMIKRGLEVVIEDQPAAVGE